MEKDLENSLRAELSEARDALETVSGSLRFQVGDAVVSALSGTKSYSGRVRALIAALQRARSLAVVSRIRRNLFTGLPREGLPNTPELLPLKELKAVERFVVAASKPGGLLPYSGPDITTPFARSVIGLVHELHQAMSGGHAETPLPPTGGALPPDRRRIVYVTQHDPARSLNGYARRTREITRGLAGAGHSVLAVVPSNARLGAPQADSVDGPVPYRHLRRPQNLDAGLQNYVGTLAGAIREAAVSHNAGIIHAASNYLNGLAAMSAARSLGVPFVYEVRGLWEETRSVIDSSFPASLGYKFQARMETLCADQADAAIMGSSGIAQELRQRGARADRFFLAESGGPVLAAHGSFNNPIRSQFPDGSFVLGYVGSITSYEGFPAIARALAILSRQDSRYRMLVVGHGPFASGAKSAFEREGVSDKVVFAGNLPFDQALAAYGLIDLAIYPRDSTRVTNIVESLKPVEALAAGVPVLVSDVLPTAGLGAACPAVLTVRAGDANDLAVKVRQFFALSEAERRSLGEAGQAWAQEWRTWRHTVDCIQKAYASLA